MKLDNPYIDLKRQLTVQVDKEKNQISRAELQQRLDEVETKCREWVQDKLEELGATTKEVGVMVDSVRELPSKAAQYRESIRLSRIIQGHKTEKEGVLVVGLVQKIRKLKEQIRRE